MFFHPRLKKQILNKALKEIEKLLVEFEKEGKDLSKVKLKKYKKTHHIQCQCLKCKEADQKNDPRLKGLLEYGFKVFVGEDDKEELI